MEKPIISKMQPRRIGIFTYTSNFNFVTFFQAYATFISVKKAFPDSKVEIVNCHSRKKYQMVGCEKLNLRKRHLYPPYVYKHLAKQRA